MTNKIKVVLHYNYGEESEDNKFKDVTGYWIGMDIGQSSALEIINCLDEMDELAEVQLVNEGGEVIKSKLVKIEF